MRTDPFLMPYHGMTTTVDAETARHEMAQQVYLFLNTEVMPGTLDIVNMIDPSANDIRQVDALVELWNLLGYFLASVPGGHHGGLRETIQEVQDRLDGKLDD